LGIELQTLLAHVRQTAAAGNNRLKKRIAVCLTQMDRPEHYCHLGSEEEYFERLYGAVPLHNWVQRDSIRFFGCSAVGILRRAGHLISNTCQDERAQPLILSPSAPPINMFAAIEWALGIA
jgi:hypothetical protein